MPIACEYSPDYWCHLVKRGILQIPDTTSGSYLHTFCRGGGGVLGVRVGIELEGVVATFAGTDSYGIVYVVDEDFAITVGTGVYLVNGKVYYLLGSFV